MLPFIDAHDYAARQRNTESIPTIITPIAGEPLRFHVQSRTEKNIQHLVDLQEYHTNGECGCEDFQFRHRPQLSGKMKRSRCWHIERVREYFTDELLMRIAENFYKD